MQKYMLSLLMVVMLAFGGSLLSAQALECGNLAQADCDILIESQAAMAELESAAFDFSLDFMLDGIPDAPEMVMFTLTGNGGYAVVNPDLTETLAQDMVSNLPQAMEALFEAFSADADLIITVPPELVGADQPNRAGFSVRLVDGFAYINLDKMAEVMGSADLSGWYGFDLAEFYRAFFEQQDFTMPDLSADTLQNIENFVTIERLEDTTHDGQAMAVFAYTYDYSALLTSDWYIDLIQQQFDLMGMGSQFDVDELREFYEQMFADMSLRMTQSIGLDDHYAHSIQLEMDWTLDMDALLALSGESSSDVGMSNMTFRIDLEASVSQFDAYPAIEAPDDAEIIPLNSLLPFSESA